MKKWNICVPDRKLLNQLILNCQVSQLTAAALLSKGYTNPQAVADNFNTDSLSDPFLIKDMDVAAETINNAIDNGEKICVYGDYDCDGIISTVILFSYLYEAGADVTYYIPERSEGYGLNKNAIDKINDENIDLIITVDNGISAISEADYIYELGMKLVVTDHHQQGDTLPRAEAVVDPHRHDCTSPFKFMCGAGIALKLTAALDGGDYTLAMEQFADLAAIATVADIVSLTGENRYLVTEGMRLIENSDRPSILALKEVCGIKDKTIDSFSIGFGIAPRINASGRFGSPKTAAKLFLCEDEEQCLEIARELDDLNSKRKNTENEILSEIYRMLDEHPEISRQRVLFLCGKNWHHGVIGIVASRLVEQFDKPCFIASESDGEIRGSARSFGEFSVFDCLTYCSDTLVKFGGHPGAGGFTIINGKQNEFNQLLQKFAHDNFNEMPVQSLNAVMSVSSTDLSFDNVDDLAKLHPFGMDNEQPMFCIDNAEILDIRPMGNGDHSMLRIKLGNSEQTAKMFRVSPEALSVVKGDICRMIITLDINEFRGNKTVNIIIKDIRSVNFNQDSFFSALRFFEALTRGEKLPNINYYKRMFPTKDEASVIYRSIPSNGISIEKLFMKISSPNINFAKLCVVAEAFRQLGLVSFSSSAQTITKQNVKSKTDLFSAPILQFMKKIIGC